MTDVLLVDDHVVFREGLRALLDIDDDFDVVGEAGSGAEALEFVRRCVPDVILLELGLPDGRGSEFCPELLSLCPQASILILSSFEDEESVTAALVAGASGYVLKTVGWDRLADNIRSVYRGEMLLSPSIAAKVVGQLTRMRDSANHRRDTLTSLTPRELEVFELASQGLKNSEIAEKLFLSEKTIKTHLRNIYGKLDLASKADLRVYAERMGQSSEPGP